MSDEKVAGDANNSKWENIANQSEHEDALIEEATAEAEPLTETEVDATANLGGLDELQEQLNSAKNQTLRALADNENLRRRMERDVASARKFALESFVGELLPVLDSMEKALDIELKEAHEAIQNMHQGVDLTAKMLLKAVEKFGVKQLDPVGEPFNPTFHEAMTTQENLEVEPNTVLMVVQKGYSLNERLVRPARVIVSTGGVSKGSGEQIDVKA